MPVTDPTHDTQAAWLRGTQAAQRCGRAAGYYSPSFTDHMTHKVARRVRQRPAPLWRIEEWGSRALVTSLATGLLLYGVGIMPVLAFAALVYSGPLAGQLSAGLGFALLGSAILCGVIALLSSYPGS